MGEGHIIRTSLDALLSTLREAAEPLSTGRLASICGMREREVLKWAHALEKSGKVKLENRIDGAYLSWAEPAEKRLPPVSPTAVYARDSSFSSDISIAREREAEARLPAPKREKVDILPESSVDVGGGSLGRIDKMIGGLKQVKGEGPLRAERGAGKEENVIDSARREAIESEETVATEFGEKPIFRPEPLEGAAERNEAAGGEEGAGTRKKESAGAGEKEEASPPRIIPPKSVIRPKFRYAGARPKKIERIRKPEPVRVTGVSLQFSERLARQMKRIERQAREIDELRNEKEKLLSDHYLPLQHRLESELETISDRVMRVQGRVAGMQKQASDLPAKVTAVEKVQISSIKAHGEMRRAYDEACALLEESSRQLAEEREKMELMLEQSREELSRHAAMSGELSSTVLRIEEMEGEASRRVAAARAALAEQAESLATAEGHSASLRELRGEIGDSIVEMKREMASAKRVLTDLERQVGQMRQIEEYTCSIRKDYDARMLEIDEYIRNGNREFETLRESVEANFVRRYLRELRALTEGYSFEFGQAKRMEGDIDSRIADERKKLEQLFEEGKKISYLFETQSQAPANPEKFEQRAETFSALDNISSNRSQVAQMIAQVIGGRTENLPKHARITASERKTEEPGPIGIAKLLANAKAKKRKARKARKARAAAGKGKKARKAAKAAKPRAGQKKGRR